MHNTTLPIGPQHPSIKEPMCLRIRLDGNNIENADLRLGYVHRGVEKILEGKQVDSALYVAERICGICEVSHTAAYLSAVESAMNISINDKVKYLRTFLIELERLHSHLMWSGFLAHEIGYETLFMYSWRERERILEIFDKYTGGRVHHNVSKIGSNKYDLPENSKKFIFDRLDAVAKHAEKYRREFEKDNIIKARLENVGVIPEKEAKRYCLVGPIARASGYKVDVRKDNPYFAFDQVDFNVITRNEGDAWARTLVRMDEIQESVNIIKQLINNMPNEKLPKPELHMNASGEAVGHVEAPRGENFYYVKINSGYLERAKIRTPTLNNIIILEKILKGYELGDVPVIVGSLDPCFGCLERIMVAKDKKIEEHDEDSFRKKYCEIQKPEVSYD
ncbi:MAG: nickel-dependent hydrogenase large subunit [Candidatus Diapherotrites archaeon]|nr:nickel-dependent hydrogenase large subunit [Candidatus Diapherotrites archaeon]